MVFSNRAFARLKQEAFAGAEEDCDAALNLNAGNLKALNRRAEARANLGKCDAAEADVKTLEGKGYATQLEPLKKKIAEKRAAKPASPAAPAGFRKMEIVEESDSDEEPPKPSPKAASPKKPASPAAATTEVLPGVSFPHTKDGLEQCKAKGNAAFQAGKFGDAVKCFSACITVGSSPSVALGDEQLSMLHSNRAFARLRQEAFAECAGDCDAALRLNPKNLKALSRRAEARAGLGQLERAEEDVAALREHGYDLSALEQKIQGLRATAAPEPAAPAQPPAVEPAPVEATKD